MPDGRRLLPSGASDLEGAAEAATARLLQVPTSVNRTLWSVAEAPAEILPFLAWALSVDVWTPGWPEQRSRSAIVAANAIHRRKGTLGAVRGALDAIDVDTAITEWWQQAPQGTPHTFALTATVTDRGLDEPTLREILDAVWRTKPVRSHLSELRAGLRRRTTAYVGCMAKVGSRLRILPPQPGTLRTDGTGWAGAGVHLVGTVRIGPVGDAA